MKKEKTPSGVDLIIINKLEAIISNQKAIIGVLSGNSCEDKTNPGVEAFIGKSLEILQRL